MALSGEQKKLILAGVLLAVATGVYWFWIREAPALPNVEFVCVATGEVFAIEQRDLPNSLPGKNPSTGQRTLVPVARKDGKYFVRDRYASLVTELGEVNRYVDPKTLEVRPR